MLHSILQKSTLARDFGIEIETGPHKLKSTVMSKPKFKGSKLQTDFLGFRNTGLSEVPIISNWILIYTQGDYQNGREGNCIDATINSLNEAYRNFTQ